MGTVNFYLDTRRIKKNGKAPLKIAISYGTNKRFLIPAHIDLMPNQWCGQITRRADRYELQRILDDYLNKVEIEVMKLTWSREIYSLSPKEIKNKLSRAMHAVLAKPTIVELFDKFIQEKSKNSTKLVYINTLKKIQEFCGSEYLISEVDKTFLKRFDSFLAEEGLRVNSRSIHLRNLRAVYNEAIDQKYVSVNDYPFRTFTIKKEETLKRNISPAKIRQIYNYSADPQKKQYADMFMLMFFFRGINIIDLCHLREITSDGYIEYRRSKTEKMLRVKVEPEALEIIERYRGKKYLLNIMDRYRNYKDYAHRLNANLKKLTDEEGNIIFDKLSTYYTRHSWGTIAASKELQFSQDIIGNALGHRRKTVTDIYIEYDYTIIDDANRRLMDWVLYGRL